MTERRECGVCWWVYDPEAGDDDAQIPPGVAWDALPDDYACPRCGAAKARFLRQRTVEEDVASLVAAYEAVDVRMRELPIHNPRLAVEAVGFRQAGELFVGAIVTPWFLNLVVLGREVPASGESVELVLPGGRFALVAAHEGVPHLALPLLSPVTEIVDREAARAVASECLRLVLEGDAPSVPAAPRGVGRRGLFAGLLGGG